MDAWFQTMPAAIFKPRRLYEDPTLAGEDCGIMNQQACFDALRFGPLGASRSR